VFVHEHGDGNVNAWGSDPVVCDVWAVEHPMMISVFTPRYKHRTVSADEREAKQIKDTDDQDAPYPTKCGDCGATGSVRNPLMMKPVFRMEHGGPKGTLYQARCSECQWTRVRRRGLRAVEH